VRPFIDLHVLRDGSSELTLYGDDDQRIEEPTPAQLLDATTRLSDALARFERVVAALHHEGDR
jgi:hypothetical protein